MNSSTYPAIIVGAGFAGLFTALHLRHQQDLRSIILIDSQAQFVFKPLLYELLTGELSEDTVCPTYEELLHGRDIHFVQDTVTAIEWRNMPFGLDSGLAGATFYLLTGFHGLHVFTGIVLMLYIYFRSLIPGNYSIGHQGVSAVSLFWHFVDVVWITLFLLLYIW